jgi:hypothetical protein
MTTLSLEASKKVYEIVGEYETEKLRTNDTGYIHEELPSCRIGIDCYPAPNFPEMIRVLPKIGEKMCWNSGFGRTGTCLIDVLYNMSIIYMNAPTEPEGMQAVEEYLLNLL